MIGAAITKKYMVQSIINLKWWPPGSPLQSFSKNFTSCSMPVLSYRLASRCRQIFINGFLNLEQAHNLFLYIIQWFRKPRPPLCHPSGSAPVLSVSGLEMCFVAPSKKNMKPITFVVIFLLSEADGNNTE